MRQEIREKLDELSAEFDITKCNEIATKILDLLMENTCHQTEINYILATTKQMSDLAFEMQGRLEEE